MVPIGYTHYIMLSTESNGKKTILYCNGKAVLSHQRHKPALRLLVEQNGKLRKHPVREFRTLREEAASCAFACSDGLVLTVNERGSVLDFSFSCQSGAVKAVLLRLSLPGRTPLWGQTSRTERLVLIEGTGRLNAKGSFVYSPRGFALGVRGQEALLDKQGGHAMVTSPILGFVLSYAEDSRQAASAVHMELAGRVTDPFPADGVYVQAGGGEIAVSCKVQKILDEHISVHGLLIDDLFPAVQKAGVPWKESYPSLATDADCYTGAGIAPCALIPLITDAGSSLGAQSLERQCSVEILRQLKASGIRYMGINPPQAAIGYSHKKLFSYASRQAGKAGLPLAFSGMGPQSDCQTWTIGHLEGSFDGEAFARAALGASYGAYGCHVAAIPLDTRVWNEGPDFGCSLELAVFSPAIILKVGAGPERDIPFLDSGKARILHNLIRVFTELKPYHEHCREQYLKARLPVHSLPRYERASAFAHYRAYMYGDDILVTVRQKNNSRKAESLLPEGEWIHFWTGQRYDGGGIVVNAEPGYPAVFYKGSSSFSDLFDAVRRNRQR